MGVGSGGAEGGYMGAGSDGVEGGVMVGSK